MSYRYEFVQTDEKVPIRFGYSIDQEYRQILQHWHDEAELIYLLSGKIEVTVNEQMREVTPGQIITINSNQIHTTRSVHPDTTAYLLQIPSFFLKHCASDTSRLLFDTWSAESHPMLTQLQERFHQMAEAYQDDNENMHLRIQSLLYDIVYLLIRYFRIPADTGEPELSSRQTQRLKEITDYIDDHYQEPLSLKELAHHVGLSYEYLSRFFKKYIGLSFSNYLDLVRLEHAYLELLGSDSSVSYIADQCGFANYQMFQKKFKSYYGQNPLAFRKSYQNASANPPRVRPVSGWNQKNYV